MGLTLWPGQVRSARTGKASAGGARSAPPKNALYMCFQKEIGAKKARETVRCFPPRKRRAVLRLFGRGGAVGHFLGAGDALGDLTVAAHDDEVVLIFISGSLLGEQPEPPAGGCTQTCMKRRTAPLF